MRIDTEPISPDLVIEQIYINETPAGINSYLYWRIWGDTPLPYDRYKKDPASKPNHVILYGELLGYMGFDWDVKIIRFDQEGGSRGYIQLLCAAKSWGKQAYDNSINRVGESPIFEGKWGGYESFNDPETQRLLKKWVADQKIPPELKYKILIEDNTSGR